MIHQWQNAGHHKTDTGDAADCIFLNCIQLCLWRSLSAHASRGHTLECYGCLSTTLSYSSELLTWSYLSKHHSFIMKIWMLIEMLLNGELGPLSHAQICIVSASRQGQVMLMMCKALDCEATHVDPKFLSSSSGFNVHFQLSSLLKPHS